MSINTAGNITSHFYHYYSGMNDNYFPKRPHGQIISPTRTNEIKRNNKHQRHTEINYVHLLALVSIQELQSEWVAVAL